MTNRCLYCYEPLLKDQEIYHPACSKKMFGTTTPPELDYTNEQMPELAEQVVKSHITITGVQPKLSLGLKNLTRKDLPKKLTIVGLWGNYILKPPAPYYEHLPELEDITMHLANLTGIATVPHALIKLQSGEFAYITKRIDRKGKHKFPMEDMCQLTERLTEEKYRGAYEQIGKALVQYSQNPGLDIINFFEQVLFSFLTGNNDMHLKNFSLYKNPKTGYVLSPAYDMIAAALVVENDNEELALTLNGKKRKITRSDFEQAAKRFDIEAKAFENMYQRFREAIPHWHSFIDNKSLLPDKMKQDYHALIDHRAKQIAIDQL